MKLNKMHRFCANTQRVTYKLTYSFFYKNSRFLLSAIFGLMFAVEMFAGDFVPVGDKKLFAGQYKSKSADIKTLETDFVQEKEITLIANKLVSNGKMIYRKDNRLKIEYLKPDNFVFAMHGNKFTIKDGTGKSSMSLKNNKLLEQVSRITTNAINGEILDSKEFDFEITENETLYLIVLLPKSKELKKYYTTFGLYINKKTFLIEKMTMDEASGDKSVTYFKNIITNNELPDEVFLVD